MIYEKKEPDEENEPKKEKEQTEKKIIRAVTPWIPPVREPEEKPKTPIQSDEPEPETTSEDKGNKE